MLPEDTSREARIATLPNPATAAPNRYLICPEKGFYEFTRIAAPKKSCRSWLLGPNQDRNSEPGKLSQVEQQKENALGQDLKSSEQNAASDDTGYVLQKPDLFIATPIDPLFLILPALIGDGNSAGQEYLAVSDFITKLAESSAHFAQIQKSTTFNKLERVLEERVESVCDFFDMGDEKMYALSLPKLVQELVIKAKRMAEKGLPASMEEHFVKEALQLPIFSIMREESNISVVSKDDGASIENNSSPEDQSQNTDASGTEVTAISTAATSFSTTPATEEEENKCPAGVEELLRLRTAINFMMTSYVPPRVRGKLHPLLHDPQVSNIDFSLLDKHLAHVASVKKEAQALRSLSDNISRKRSVMEDEDAIEKAEAKKRKKEEEESRKKNVSMGVKQLLKADTSGMKKLSAFFAAAPAKKKV